MDKDRERSYAGLNDSVAICRRHASTCNPGHLVCRAVHGSFSAAGGLGPAIDAGQFRATATEMNFRTVDGQRGVNAGSETTFASKWVVNDRQPDNLGSTPFAGPFTALFPPQAD